MKQELATTTEPMSSDVYRALGYRDCGRETLRYLAENVKLSPTNPIVIGVRRIVDSSAHPHQATVTELHRHAAHRRQPHRGSCLENRPIRSRNVRCRRRLLEADRGDIDARRPSTASTCQRPGVLLPPVESLLPRCRLEASTSCQAVDLTISTSERRALRPIQPTGRRSPPVDGGSCPRGETPSSLTDRDVTDPARYSTTDAATPADVIECAGILASLARTDNRVGSLLSELMDLMDSDSDDNY